MGRFASTIPYYARYREPYPAVFFSTVAERLGLRGDEKQLDAGCGPGLLAIGFAPFVGWCTGVDPEPGMLSAARAAAAQSRVDLKLIESRIEDLPESIGTFDLVTIGRAIHWMDREPTLRVLDRILASGGTILSCGARIASSNLWAKAYEELLRSWADEPDHRRYHIDHAAWFAGSRFRVIEEIKISFRHQVTISDLVGRALSRSNTSLEVLGDRQAEFETAVRRVLEPFSKEGSLDEEIEPLATVVK